MATGNSTRTLRTAKDFLLRAPNPLADNPHVHAFNRVLQFALRPAKPDAAATIYMGQVYIICAFSDPIGALLTATPTHAEERIELPRLEPKCVFEACRRSAKTGVDWRDQNVG